MVKSKVMDEVEARHLATLLDGRYDCWVFKAVRLFPRTQSNSPWTVKALNPQTKQRVVLYTRDTNPVWLRKWKRE